MFVESTKDVRSPDPHVTSSQDVVQELVSGSKARMSEVKHRNSRAKSTRPPEKTLKETRVTAQMAVFATLFEDPEVLGKQLRRYHTGLNTC